MKIFDTHAHIGLIYSDPIERLKVVRQAKQAGVNRIISICNSLHDFNMVYETLKGEATVFHAVGVSPSQVTAPGINWEKSVEENLKRPNVVALGETGLDYCKKYGDKRSQIELFIKQLDIASKKDMPVIIHNREAGKDMLDILRERLPKAGAVFHCYSEDTAFAKKALSLPVYFSFAGNLTYKNAKNLQETVKILPLDRIVVESESPFMPPAIYKKQRNKPANIVETVKFMANLLNIDIQELAAQLWKNSCKFFRLPE